jgi:hypothetical protein
MKCVLPVVCSPISFRAESCELFRFWNVVWFCFAKIHAGFPPQWAALSKHVSIREKSIRQSRQASLRDPLVTYLALCEDRNCSEYPWCHRYISSGWGTFQFPCLTQSRIVFWVSIVQIGNGRRYAFRGQRRPATLARQSSKKSLHILIRIGKLNLYLLKQYLDTQF